MLKNLCTDIYIYFFFFLDFFYAVFIRKIGKPKFLEACTTVFLRSNHSENVRFSSNFSVGISKKNLCAKVQRKTINPVECDLLEILDLSRQNKFLVNHKPSSKINTKFLITEFF